MGGAGAGRWVHGVGWGMDGGASAPGPQRGPLRRKGGMGGGGRETAVGVAGQLNGWAQLRGRELQSRALVPPTCEAGVACQAFLPLPLPPGVQVDAAVVGQQAAGQGVQGSSVGGGVEADVLAADHLAGGKVGWGRARGA